MSLSDEEHYDIPTDEEGPVNVTGHAYDWQVKDFYTDKNHLEIQAWCLDRESKPFLMRVQDFPATCYIELPSMVGRKRKQWRKEDADKVFSYLKFCLQDNPPEHYFFNWMQKLYYYKSVVISDPDNPGQNKYVPRLYPMMLVTFPNKKAMWACKKLLEVPREPRGVGGRCVFKVWETGIDVERKMLTVLKMQYSQWFKFTAPPVGQIDRISTVDEYIVPYSKITPIPIEETTEWRSEPKIFSYDIEAYCENHKGFPRGTFIKDVCYIITIVFQIGTRKETRKRYALVYGHCKPSKRAETIIVNSEMALIGEFERLIRELDPEIITGFNIMGFDNVFLDKKLKLRFANWTDIGRLATVPAKVVENSWSSSAYGKMNMFNLNCEGRINIDVFLMIKREYKLSTYDLNTVSKKFLKRGKHDVSHLEMFRIFKLYLDNCEEYDEYSTNKYFTEADKEIIDQNWKGGLHIIEQVTGQKLKRQGNENDDKKEKTKSEKEKEERDRIEIEEQSKIIRPLFDRKLEEIISGSLSKEKDNDGKEDKQQELFDFFDVWMMTCRYYESLNEMTKVVEYGIEDAELVMDIFDTINAYTAIYETSNVCGCNMEDLYTKGQQRRGLSLVYDLAFREGIVLDSREQEYIPAAGGYVGKPDPGLYDYVMCVDFTSLYPTIMMGYNICWTTYVPPELDDIIPDDMCHVIEWDDEVELEDSSDEEGESTGRKKKKNVIEIVHRRYKFVKASVKKGILPMLEEHLVGSRNVVKKQMGQTKDPVLKAILNSRQLALKVTCNSCYGILGAQKAGKISLIEAAITITALGRKSIMIANEKIKEWWGGKIVYGDSVTGDTPILCKLGYKIFYRTIDNLPKEGDYDQLDKEYAVPKRGLQVWSDKGFTQIKHIMRHKTRKRIYRILTHTGCVDVTEDHSLLNEAAREVKPVDVKVGETLLHRDLPKTASSENKYINIAYQLGLVYGNGSRYNDYDSVSINRVAESWKPHFYDSNGQKKIPDFILTADLETQEWFYGGYRESNAFVEEEEENKIGRAGLFLLKSNIGKCKDYEGRQNEIKEIIDLGYSDDYVYDLETENHHFAAGIGRMIVHNTDSTFFTVPNCKNGLDCVTKGPEYAEKLSTLYPAPMKFEFEKALRMICIAKKKYCGFLYSEYDVKDRETGEIVLKKGELNTNMYEMFVRGIILARRDNCKWQQEVYRQSIWKILMYHKRTDIYDTVCEHIDNLVNGRVGLSDLVLVRTYNNTKSLTYFMNIFGDRLKKKGNPVQPGDRLEYVVVKTLEEQRDKLCKPKLGYKLTLITDHIESLGTSEEEPIDYKYYIEKLLKNPVEQIYEIAFQDELSEMVMAKHKEIDKDIMTEIKRFNEETDELIRMGKRLTKKRQQDHEKLLRKFENAKRKATIKTNKFLEDVIEELEIDEKI